MTRRKLHRLGALGLACLLAIGLAPASASNWGARQEFREGAREIARERREMRRDILNSNSKWEARQAYREGMREIGRERREMRREIYREVRHNDWDADRRRDRNRAIAGGIVLGAVIAAAARGREPTPPEAGLCWRWSDSRRERGYWYRCGEYYD